MSARRVESVARQADESVDPESLRDPDRAPPRSSAATTTDYFVFRIRGRTYALPPSCIELVAAMQPLVPVPTAGSYVSGVIHLRGRIIAVVELAALLGVDDRPPQQESARLVVVAASSPFAVVVDTTLGICACADHSHVRSADDGPLVNARVEHVGGAATVIDPDAVIERVVALRSERL